MFGVLYDLSHAIQHKKAIGSLSTKQKSHWILEHKRKKAIGSLEWSACAPAPPPASGVAAPSRLHAPQPVAGERGGCTAPQPAANRSPAPPRGAAAKRSRVCCSEGGERLWERRHRLCLLGRLGRGTVQRVGGGESGAEGEESLCGGE
jgi:hypothetical protein